MEKNDIKKALYKQNPNAIFKFIRKGTAHYSTVVEAPNHEPVEVRFEVPVSDMGEADFEYSIEAKYMNRWIAE